MADEGVLTVLMRIARGNAATAIRTSDRDMLSGALQQFVDFGDSDKTPEDFANVVGACTTREQLDLVKRSTPRAVDLFAPPILREICAHSALNSVHVSWLVDNGCSLNASLDSYNTTPLSAATTRAAVRALVVAGAAPSSLSAEHISPLYGHPWKYTVAVAAAEHDRPHTLRQRALALLAATRRARPRLRLPPELWELIDAEFFVPPAP